MLLRWIPPSLGEHRWERLSSSPIMSENFRLALRFDHWCHPGSQWDQTICLKIGLSKLRVTFYVIVPMLFFSIQVALLNYYSMLFVHVNLSYVKGFLWYQSRSEALHFSRSQECELQQFWECSSSLPPCFPLLGCIWLHRCILVLPPPFCLWRPFTQLRVALNLESPPPPCCDY